MPAAYAGWLRLHIPASENLHTSGSEQAQQSVLFDQLVGAGEQPIGYREAKCFGNFEVYDQLIMTKNTSATKLPEADKLQRNERGAVPSIRSGHWRFIRLAPRRAAACRMAR